VGRSSRTSILKRQRELRRAEKAAKKRARRHGKPLEGPFEMRPTLSVPQDDAEGAPVPDEGEGARSTGEDGQPGRPESP